MAVIEMKKISFIGFIYDREKILDFIMKKGAVEIDSLDDSKDNDTSLIVSYDSELHELESKMTQVKSAVNFLSKFDKSRKGLFFARREISESDFSQICKSKDSMNEKVKGILKIEDRINSLKTKINRLNNDKESLMPWINLSLALESSGTDQTRFIKGNIPVMIDLDEISDELEMQSDYIHFESTGRDKDWHYIIVVCLAQEYRETFSVLKKYGFSEFFNKSFVGTAKSNVQKIESEISKLKEEIQVKQKQAEKYSDDLDNIKAYYDSLKVETDKFTAMNRMISTQSTFAFRGWVPAAYAEDISTKLISQWNCYVVIEQPGEDEQFPVLLKNPPLAGSVEMITGMYSLPDCREADPNRIVAPFFFMFFGLMLGDGGYGLLLAAFSGIAIWKFRMEESTKRFMKMMMYCGIATIFWGAMFGGWFGDLIPALAGDPKRDISIWFNPINDPEYLLMWSLLFGVIHMFVGIGIKGYNFIKQKKYLDAIIDSLFWYVLFTGLIMVVMPFVPAVDQNFALDASSYGKYVLLTGIILIVLSGIKDAKNLFVGLFKGIAKLYDLISFLSDVLSYSRILALGLATSVIATIVNQMAMMAGFNVLGSVVFILVFIAGHSLNIALNSLSAYVHSSRLQYIEFFGKFYKGGGKAFSPLKIDTDYIKLK